MKRILLSLAVMALASVSLSAQKIVYFNSETVLKAIPEYVAAQDRLNKLSDKYKSSIEAEVAKIEALYQNYQSKKASMTPEQRTVAENEIISKEKVTQEKEAIYFGEDGIMARNTEEMITPIREKLDAAIKALAEANAYDLVLDASVMPGVVYTNPALDVTKAIITEYNNQKSNN